MPRGRLRSTKLPPGRGGGRRFGCSGRQPPGGGADQGHVEPRLNESPAFLVEALGWQVVKRTPSLRRHDLLAHDLSLHSTRLSQGQRVRHDGTTTNITRDIGRSIGRSMRRCRTLASSLRQILNGANQSQCAEACRVLRNSTASCRRLVPPLMYRFYEMARRLAACGPPGPMCSSSRLHRRETQVTGHRLGDWVTRGAGFSRPGPCGCAL